MQNVSNNLLSEQLQQDQKYVRHVEVYRRYWDGSAYVWDSSPIIIDDYVKEVSTIKWKLDTTHFNEWKSSNFQVILNNRRNYFSEIEPNGFWQTGPNQPYVPDMTKIKIKVGQKLEDGTVEELYIITGLINKPLAFNEEDNTVQIDCVGLDALLLKTPADIYSSEITDEYCGVYPWDIDSVQTFHTNVLEVTKVTYLAAGVDLKEGVDYTVSNLGVKDERAIISLKNIKFNTDDKFTARLKINYKIAYTDKDPSWIVEQLLLLAGITTYTISNTEFDIAYSIYKNQMKTYYLKDATNKNNIDIYGDRIKIGLNLFDDFADGDITNNPTWTADDASSLKGYGVDVVDRILRLRKVQNVKADNTIVVGTWEFRGNTINCRSYFYFISLYGYGTTSDNGYHVEISITDNTIRLFKDDGGTGALLGSSSIDISEDEWYVVRITRDTSGNFNVYLNGDLKISVTDTSYDTSNYVLFKLGAVDSNNLYEFKIDYIFIDSNIYAPGNYTSSASYESTVLDGGAGLQSWDTIAFNLLGDSSASYKIETYTSGTSDFSSDNDPNGWVEVTYGAPSTINSAAKRYLKYKVTLTSSGSDTRILENIQIYYSTKSTTLPIVNLTNETVLSAIRAIAGMVSYEIGFDVDDSYFYRKRSTAGDPIIDIDARTNLEKEIEYNTGTDRVYNKIRVNYGIYKEEVDSNTEGEASPTSIDKYGERVYTVSGVSFLNNDAANFSLAIAKSLYNYTSSPKKRAKVRIKMLMQLQLGDKVKYLREHKFGRWLWGDTDRTYGNETDMDFVYYTNPDTNGWNIVMRVEGIEFNTESARMILDLTEA